MAHPCTPGPGGLLFLCRLCRWATTLQQDRSRVESRPDAHNPGLCSQYSIWPWRPILWFLILGWQQLYTAHVTDVGVWRCCGEHSTACILFYSMTFLVVGLWRSVSKNLPAKGPLTRVRYQNIKWAVFIWQSSLNCKCPFITFIFPFTYGCQDHEGIENND